MPGSAVPSISECTSPESLLEGLDAAVDDFVQALSAFNRTLNGEVPSQSFDHADSVPAAAAYAVSEANRMLRDYRGSAENVGRAEGAAWAIETAWNAVLAGDIDDLAQHIRDAACGRER